MLQSASRSGLFWASSGYGITPVFICDLAHTQCAQLFKFSHFSRRSSLTASLTASLWLLIGAAPVAAGVTDWFKAYEPSAVVSDPYLELHTGPGRGYPIFYVAGQGDKITLLKERTEWYKIRTPRGKEGWVNVAQLRNTLDLDGGFTLWVRRPVVGRRDYGSEPDENDRVILTAEGTAPTGMGAGTGRSASLRRLEISMRLPTGGIQGNDKSDASNPDSKAEATSDMGGVDIPQ